MARKTRRDKDRTKIAPDLLQLIEGLALQKPPLSAAAIQRQVATVAGDRGQRPPSYSLVYAVVRKIDPSLVTLAHEGTKAYCESFDLVHRREADAPNAIWQADHSELDILVKDDKGNPRKPWLTIILDDYSRAVAGYFLSLHAPSAIQTSLALRQAIWRKTVPAWHVCGIPEVLYTDHGSDFTSRHIEEVAADLKIRLIFSTVAKPRGRGKLLVGQVRDPRHAGQAKVTRLGEDRRVEVAPEFTTPRLRSTGVLEVVAEPCPAVDLDEQLLPVQIQVGYELVFRCQQPTPMVVTLSIHYSRVSDLIKADHLVLTPSIPVTAYRDSFGNWCSRIVAPPGQLRLSSDAVVSDTGNPDLVAPWLEQRPVEALPEETLLFLLGSRYCETDLLSETAWRLFNAAPTGWKRVQAICDFVHQHIQFGYGLSSPTKSAFQVFQDRKGVCRDFAHLAVTLCRCMNIPARYCTGYLGYIGRPPADSPMDFAAWFEAYLSDAWYTFDARNNTPRIGRILIARGRDAADVALTTSFGPSTLESLKVWTDEISAN